MLKYVIFSFWIVLMYPLGVDLHLTGIPQIAADLNAPESALHTAFSVYLAGMAAMMLIAGWCADHIGCRPVALAGAVIFCLASVAAGSAVTTGFFLGARFVQGAGAGFCYVVTFALLRDVLPGPARTKILSMMNGITCIAPVLAPVIGFFILLYFHWSVMFYFSAGYALVSIIFCLCFIKETRPDKHTAETAAAGDEQPEDFVNAFFLTPLMLRLERVLPEFLHTAKSVAEIRDSDNPKGVQFRLLMEEPLNLIMLHDLAVTILNHYPESAVSIRDWDYNSLSEVIAGEADIGLLGRESYPKSRESISAIPDIVNFDLLFTDRPLAFIRHGHPLLSEAWTISNLIKYPHISTEYANRIQWPHIRGMN